MFSSRFTYLILILLAVNIPAYSAEWEVYEVEDFYFYYQGDKINEIQWMEQRFKKELFKLQNELNYHLNDKVDIFLKDHSTEELPYEEDWGEEPSITGVIQDIPYRIHLDVEKDPISLMEDFRGQASIIILYEMMYGATIQDQIRSANIYYLPKWVMEGLELYIRGGWTSQLDNEWRLVYEDHGVKNFNLIPSRFNALKGAAFLKFLNDEYGSSSIPTVLYMSRVSRKFNSALFYAFQKTNRELFHEWREFYDHAYSLDLRKRLPINGSIHQQSTTKDICVLGLKNYVLLEALRDGFVVNQYKNDLSKTLYTISKDEKVINDFVGAIQQFNSELLVFLQTAQGVRMVNLSTGSSTQLGIHSASKIFQQNGELYILQSGLLSSKLFKLKNNRLHLQKEFNEYIYDAEVLESGLLLFLMKDRNSGKLVHLKGQDTSVLLHTNYRIKQMIRRNDLLYFNTNQNGVYNGARISLNSDKIEYLTDYRTDIAYHQWSDSIFAEYLLRLDRSSLLITEYFGDEEVYVYDSITPMFFRSYIAKPEPVIVDESYKPSQDSLPNYIFQSPVPPARDFTSSNYDSLMQVAEEQREQDAQIGKPEEFFKPSSFFIQLYNGLGAQEDVGFASELQHYLPSKLGVRLGGSLVNQFEDRSLYFNYFSLRNLESHDVTVSYLSRRTKIPFMLTFLHRQRVNVFSSTLEATYFNKNRVEQITASSRLLTLGKFQLNASLRYRYDALIPLSTDMKSLLQEGENKSQIASFVDLQYNRDVSMRGMRWNWKAKLSLSPYLQFSSSTISMRNMVELDVRKNISQTIRFEGVAKGGFSLGSNPYYFVLGGTASDLLANYQFRNFSDFKDPAYFQMVYGIRGFNTNYRNGTSFGLVNAQLVFKPLKHLIKKPLISELFNQLELVVFSDIATSMYSNSIYHEANALNTEVFNTPGGSFTVEVQNIKNPLIGSLGGGLHTQMFNYIVKADLAYGIESASFKDPMLHISVGRVIQ